MASKGSTVRATVLLFLAMASVVVIAHTLDVTTSTTTANAAASVGHPDAVEQAIHPLAGCRCCWFIWGPPIRCGSKVCCQDGCC